MRRPNPCGVFLFALAIAGCSDGGSSDLVDAAGGGTADATFWDATGNATDAAGNTTDAAGNATDAPGNATDAPGNATDAPGNTTDAPGNTTDAPGNTTDAMISVPDAQPLPPDAMMTGIIGGGPCISGANGATAYRVRWADGGNTAYVVYEVNGLPDTSRDHTGAYGYQIGFTPSFVDPFLGEGGLRLDGSDFVDIEISTAGVSQISEAWLSIYGRSFHTTASGSFNWQTFSGTGSTPTNFVSNVAPYQWYSADMTTAIDANDNTILIRIKAGPNSGVLVVNRIELCMVAQ